MSAKPNQPHNVLDQELGLVEAAQAVFMGSVPKLSTQALLTLLLDLEKIAGPHSSNTFADFAGTWRLCFVTGTQKPHQSQNKVIGKGYYIPRWAKLQLVYSPGNPTEYGPQDSDQIGQIANQVHWGGLHLSLTGPTRCWTKKNIMVFDFTRLEFKVFGKTVYKGFIRGGRMSEKTFWDEHVRTQAFFVYFLIHDQVLAARGRGGGIALWAKTTA